MGCCCHILSTSVHVLVAVPSIPTPLLGSSFCLRCPSFEVWFLFLSPAFRLLSHYSPTFLAVVGKIGGVTSDTCTSDLFILLTIILLTPDWAKVLISGFVLWKCGGPEGTSSWSSFGLQGSIQGVEPTPREQVSRVLKRDQACDCWERLLFIGG